ncbi:MAG: peptidoglycan DD-metalloendopeptidase family protein [Actinomycetota bacterium]|nr:peptidoglycan DD-metalloendopeptidase family protein [Actinomycetota bacterium]
MRLKLLLATLVIPLALWALLPLGSSAAPSRQAEISKKIDAKRAAIDKRKGRERVLSSTIAGYSRRIGRLQGDISVLQARQAKIQGDLDAKRAELARIQARLRAERARLVRLRVRLAEARAALSERLVALFKADKPDVVTVVLEAEGFADLLSRTEFMQRVSEQDARILDVVRRAKADATATAKRLDRLEERGQKVAAVIMARRDEVAAVKGQLVERRDAYAAVRSDKQSSLATVRESRQNLEGDLAALEKEQAKIQAALQAAAGGPSAGPIRQGSGALSYPVNGPIVSPFGPRWGRLHAGIDIAVPAGTPIRAADSGKVVLLGWTGGYGNYTCISHGSLSTCYAHQSRYATSQGANVSKGQVIGYIGCTGSCFGDHLHFETRVNGSPVDPMGYL